MTSPLRFAVRVVSLLGLASGILAAAEPLVREGNGRFEFSAWGGPALPVYYHAPAEVKPTTPVLFVMHGMVRNGDEYRDQWADLARDFGFLLLVPTFSQRDFPDLDGYNHGNVIGPDGTRKPAEQWAFTAIEKLFDHVRERTGITTEKYSIYGHSAGAQFVHRLFFFLPHARAERVVSANAGVYLVPDFTIDHPYGLKGSGITVDDVKLALQRPVLVLLGEADMDPNHRPLPRTPGAMAQGIHRFSRGLNYFRVASELTVKLRVPFGWKLDTVPGVAHSNTHMAPDAAEHLYGKKRP